VEKGNPFDGSEAGPASMTLTGVSAAVLAGDV